MTAQTAVGPPKQNAPLRDKGGAQVQVNATNDSVKASGPLVSGVKNAAEVETRDCNAQAIINGIRDGKWRKPIEGIRGVFSTVMADSGGDRKAAKEAVAADKRKLPGLMWSGLFSTREKPAAERLRKHSGLLCADLDDLGERLADVRAKLLASPHLFALVCITNRERLESNLSYCG
jgi:hypothetical protein